MKWNCAERRLGKYLVIDGGNGMSMNRVTKRKPYAYGCLYPVACFWLTSTYEIVYLTKIAYIWRGAETTVVPRRKCKN